MKRVFDGMRCNSDQCLVLGTLLVALVLGVVAFAVPVDETSQMRNVYGQTAVLNRDQVFVLEKGIPAYQIDEPDANTTYIRYDSGTGSVFIKKISVSGNVTTVEKAYATWANRAAATYTPIND
jgi:hypothetical protein